MTAVPPEHEPLDREDLLGETEVVGGKAEPDERELLATFPEWSA